MTAEISGSGPLDLARYIRPGALVAWGQGCAEPAARRVSGEAGERCR